MHGGGLSAGHVSDLVEAFVRGAGVRPALTRVCAIALDLSGASRAAVLLASPGEELAVGAASDARALRFLHAQVALDEGPWVRAIRSVAPVWAPDVGRVDRRWPRLAAQRPAGVSGSAWVLPLTAAGQALGALGVLQRPDRRPAAVRLADTAALAGVATLLLRSHHELDGARRVVEQLQGALSSRVAIEQAKGRLAERHQVSLDEAFRRLRRYARDQNLKLQTVAYRVARDRAEV